VPIAASIGVATFPADGRTATELIAAADGALYRVKRDGGHDAAVAGEGAAA
jgi:GGDEF domain-containing protein